MGEKARVAQIAGLERTADNVVDVGVADQSAALGVPDEVAGLIRANGAVEGNGAVRRSHSPLAPTRHSDAPRWPAGPAPSRSGSSWCAIRARPPPGTGSRRSRPAG